MAGNPILFSSYFGGSTTAAALAQMNVVDPILNFDLPYFIDPLLLATSAVQPEMVQAEKRYENYFRDVVQALRDYDHNPVPARFDAAIDMLTFPEIPGVGLGYGVNSSAGSGMGKHHAQQLVTDALAIVRAGYHDPSLFSVVMLLGTRIGADKISDMTSGIIQDELMGLSQRVAQTLGLPVIAFPSRTGKTFMLIENPIAARRGKSIPTLFVPNDVIRHVPVAGNFSGLYQTTVSNQQIRDSVSATLGALFKGKSDTDRQAAKSGMRAAVTANVQLIPEIVSILNEVNKMTPTSKASVGTVASLALALQAMSSALVIGNGVGTYEENIVAKACDVVSNRKISAHFKDASGNPKPTKECRILFMVIVGHVIDANPNPSGPQITVAPKQPASGRPTYVIRLMPAGDHIVDFVTSSKTGFQTDFVKHCNDMAADSNMTYHQIMFDVGNSGQPAYQQAETIEAALAAKGQRVAKLYKVDA